MPYTPTNWIEAVTTLGPTHLNNLESGVSKAPYGPDASSSNVPIWSGSAWTYGLISNSNIASSAAIAKSKLAALNIADADVAAGANIAQSKLNLDASSLGRAIVSGTRTSSVSTSGTTFGTGNDLLASALSFTADGTSSYLIRAVSSQWQNSATNANVLRINLDGADAGFFAVHSGTENLAIDQAGLIAAPAAGAHTVNVRMTVNAGTGTVTGGAGGVGVSTPILVALYRV